jgi:hypothetical protein
MSCVRVTTGTIEPIQVYATDLAGDPLVGASDLFVRARRASDGAFLDWADLAFKSAGWTQLDRPLVEDDPTYAPGLYSVAGGLDTATLGDDLDLVVIPLQTPGVDAVLPSPTELKIGQWPSGLSTRLLEVWQRLHLDPSNERVDTPDRIKIPADGSLIDIEITTVGTEITGRRL